MSPIILCLVALLATASAFHAPRAFHTRATSLSAESKPKDFTIMEILSGKAAVAAEKKSSPTLFGSPTKKVVAKKVKISESAQKAIDLYRVSASTNSEAIFHIHSVQCRADPPTLSPLRLTYIRKRSLLPRQGATMTLTTTPLHTFSSK
jgi:hypothetical protein